MSDTKYLRDLRGVRGRPPVGDTSCGGSRISAPSGQTGSRRWFGLVSGVSLALVFIAAELERLAPPQSRQRVPEVVKLQHVQVFGVVAHAS
jgi:hypothetical protein